MPATTPRDLWRETYHHQNLKGGREVSVITAILGDQAPARLVAKLQIETTGSAGVDATVSHSLTPVQMRELAILLMAAADRIDTELQPLLDQLTRPAHKIIPIVQQTTEPPASLYAEPEVI